MTIRIPKWLLAIGLLVVVAAAAFLLGRSTDGDDQKATGTADETSMPRCSKREAEKAVIASEFDESVHAHEQVQASLADAAYPPVEPPFFSDNPSDYQIALLRCGDLGDDGSIEMVVAVSAGASGHIGSWAIFKSSSDGGWRFAFDRVGVPVSSLSLDGETIVANTPTFAKGDPLCCPSGHKATRVALVDGGFHLVPPPEIGERQMVVSDGRVLSLGHFKPPVDSPTQAFAAFETPTEVVSSGREACTLVWSDLGLTLDFANFGGGEACGPEGRVAFIELFGDAAEQAGWRVGGARVGMEVDALRNLYPGAREIDGEVVLVETPTVIGTEGTVAILTAYTDKDRVVGFRAYVGAAGE